MTHGSSFECFLSYSSLRYEVFYSIIDYMMGKGFTKQEDNFCGIYANDDPVSPIFILSDKGFEYIHSEDIRLKNIDKIIMSFKGILYDVNVNVTVIIDFINKVVVFGTLEGFLWNFNPYIIKPKYERLEHFAILCLDYIKFNIPIYAARDNGSIYPPLMTEEYLIQHNLTEKYKYTSSFLSKEDIEETISWYKDNY